MPFPRIPTIADKFQVSSEAISYAGATGWADLEIHVDTEGDDGNLALLVNLKFTLSVNGCSTEFYAGDVLADNEVDQFGDAFMAVTTCHEPQNDRLDDFLALICERFVEKNSRDGLLN